jgi:TctA family transporter
MIIAAITLITFAVILGSYLLKRILQKKHPPKAIVFAHGACAVLGIILILIYALTTDEHHKHWDSFVIFSIAAIVGIYLFSRDIRHKNVPKWLAILHGSVGLFGIVWILTHVLH